MQPGLVSITFRKLTPAEVIALCAANRLSLIEWGGDIHVPHGNLEAAREVGAATRAAGLGVSSYGSYYRLGKSREEGLEFSSVLETAVALEAPIIRVWPGTIPSATATAEYRQAIVDEALAIADQASARGVLVGYEFHANTLTDATESAVDLLERTRHPAIRTFWQPYNGQTAENCLASLRAVLPWVHCAHVFHWWPDNQHRLPLAEGRDRWTRYLEILATLDSPLLLEFVQNDDPAQLVTDAATLHEWIGTVR